MDQWIPLIDYAIKTDTSLSTLRRQIKSNKIRYKMVKGKYFILDNEVAFPGLSSDEEGETPSFFQQLNLPNQNFSPSISSPLEYPTTVNPQIFDLQTELHKAQKEIAELKTLIAFYEETLSESQENAT